jgi:PAS domain S-box-containing protein
MIVHTTDENTLFKKVCDIAIHQGQFRLAWIGMIDEMNQHVIPVMFAGDEREYLTKIKKIQIPDVPEGRGPTGTAIREGKYVISNDIANDPKMLPWKEEALLRGFQSSISVPIIKFGKVVGAFTVYAAEKHFFDKEETALLLEATGDISFALEIIENEKLRKQSEILLKEERDKFAKIAETSPGLIYSFNQSPEKAVFNFPYAGKTIENIFGFTKKELEEDANVVIKYFHPDDSERISATIQSSAATMMPWKCEFRYLHPAKGEIWLEGHTIPKKESNESTTWYGVIIDITERKKAELNIIDSEQKYRTLFDTSLDGILLATPNGKILAANPAACDIFNMTEEEIITSDRSKIVDIFDTNLNKLLSERAENGKVRGELIMFRKNGEPFTSEIASSVFNDINGEPKSSIIIRDITQRKKAIKELQDSIFRFEMITRATNDALWEWNFETGDLWANETHQHLYGLSSTDPVPKDIDWVQRIHPDDRDAVAETQSRSLQSDKSIFISEYRFRNAKNEYRYIYDRCYILRDQALKPIRMVGSMMDITEQKNAEQEIIESEKRFRSSLDKMLEGVQIINFDWKYLYVNETAAKHGNTTRESLEGFTMMEKYPGIEQSVLFSTLQKCMIERKADFLVNNFIYPDNTNAWFELSIQPVPEGVFILSIDITERKKKEEEIKQSEEKRSLIMKAALDAIICFDTNGIITFWNPQAEEIFGWREDEVMGARFAPLIFTSQYQNSHLKELDNYLENRNKNSTINVLTELKVLNRNHQEFPAEMTIVPIIQDDEEFFCVFIRDISERRRAQEMIKKSEEQYRSLFNLSPLPKWIYDVETFKILEVNEAAVKHYGYSKKQFTSMSVKDIRPAEDVEKFINMEHHNAYSLAFNVGEWRHLKADGSIINVEISGHPIEYNGRAAMMIISNDITARKKSETVISNINKELHDLSAHLQTIREEERVQIARDIHDELGQQLTGLKLAIEWLNLKVGNNDNQLREKTLEMIALIKATIQSVRRISTNLRPSMLDDLGLVAALEWQSQEVEKRFGIMVNFISEIPDTDLPIEISTALFRIYQESLTNAVRHSGAHEISSRLKIIDSKIILEIKDDGRGIDEAKRAATKSFGLLGIKERTFAMNGTFELQSEPGKGTFIKIEVPI